MKFIYLILSQRHVSCTFFFKLRQLITSTDQSTNWFGLWLGLLILVLLSNLVEH